VGSPIERRAKQRYRLKLAADCHMDDGMSAMGSTIDISSRGARLRLTQMLPLGARLRVYVAWPVQRENSTPVCLRINGLVTRSDGNAIVITFLSHDFVTVT
jgi:hypothetical protein